MARSVGGFQRCQIGLSRGAAYQQDLVSGIHHIDAVRLPSARFLSMSKQVDWFIQWFLL